MIALYIFIRLLVFCALILFLPVTVNVGYKDDFVYRLRILGIKVYDSDKEISEPDNAANKTEGTVKKEDKEPNVFEKLKQKFGFTEAIKILFSFAKLVFTHIKKYLRHIKINKVILNLSVAGSDAAQTAIEYGMVCSAVYPVLSLVSSVADIKYKQINVSADFNSDNSKFDFKLNLELSLLFLLIIAFKAFEDYKNFTEEYFNERK